MDDSATCPAAPSSDRNKILAAKIEKSKNWTDGVKAGEKNASTNIEAKMNYCFIRTIKSFIATIFLNRADFLETSRAREIIGNRKSGDRNFRTIGILTIDAAGILGLPRPGWDSNPGIYYFSCFTQLKDRMFGQQHALSLPSTLEISFELKFKSDYLVFLSEEVVGR